DPFRDGERDAPFLARDVADRRADEAEEVPFDPLAREVVRHRENEGVVGELGPVGLGEPRSIRGLVEGPFEPTGDLVPQALRSQLNWAIHAAVPLLSASGSGEHSSVPSRLQRVETGDEMLRICRGLSDSTPLSTPVE